jgi:anthranilate phosphoribosyltransferase
MQESWFMSAESWFAPTLASLLDGKDLDPVRMCALMHAVLDGACGEAELAAVLIALRAKGETADELAAAAVVLREYMTPLSCDREDLLDTCGTGGDGAGTFNISTATALVVAGAGVPVVKHGNFAVSSRSGSADVLAVLGVAVGADPPAGRRCLDQVGMAFCLAPRFHPVLARVGPVRKRLGVRTLFNLIGPLANPAGAAFHLLGVGRAEWLDPMAGALARLGVRRALLVCGRDGLDEVSLAGPTLVREVSDGQVRVDEWTPEDFGLATCRLDELAANGPEQSAARIRSVLAGEDGPAARVVQANAAAALLVSGRATSLAEGVALAREALQSGRAARVLADLAAWSTGVNESGPPHGGR